MKTRFNSLLFLLLLPALLFANDPKEGKYTRQKTISKAYIVNPDAGIDIQNMYGSIYVTTWNEDKIEINVLIKVSGDKEDWVDKRINDINVDLNALKTLVTAKTIIANSGNSGKNNSLEINYTIKIPKNGSVKLNNKYGNIITTDLAASVNVACKYGKIELGKITGSDSVINIEYCSQSTMGSFKNADINAKYSKLTLNDFGKLGLNGDYTDVVTANGGDVKYDCSYGKLNFGKVRNLEGKGDYLDLKAGEISGSLKVQTQYSKIKISNVTANAKDININSAYTNADVDYNANYAFNFDVTVKYANFKYEDDVEMQSKQDSSFSKSYQGYYKKSGDNKVTIRSEYGNVDLSKN